MSSSGSTCSARSSDSRISLRPARAARTPAARIGAEVERAQREPQRGRGRAGARALQADLAEVQLAAREVGVRANRACRTGRRRVAEQHRAAAVGLQAVLVRVDDDAVGSAIARNGAHRDELVEQREEPAVRRVDVDAHAVALAQRDRLARPRRPCPSPVVPAVTTTVPTPPLGTRSTASRSSVRDRPRTPSTRAHARVRVVRVGAERDRLVRVQLARHPQRLEVGDRAARRQMAERVVREPEHRAPARARPPSPSRSSPARRRARGCSC